MAWHYAVIGLGVRKVVFCCCFTVGELSGRLTCRIECDIMPLPGRKAGGRGRGDKREGKPELVFLNQHWMTASVPEPRICAASPDM